MGKGQREDLKQALHTVKAGPDAGLESTNCEIMTKPKLDT